VILREVSTITARSSAAGAPRSGFHGSGDPEMRRRQWVLATLLATLLAALLALAVPASLWAGTGESAARCVRLDDRMAELRLKLRMGYSAKQGRLYRQKMASLEAERKSLCRKGR